jgi:hypothetical protein
MVFADDQVILAATEDIFFKISVENSKYTNFL